MPRHTRTSTDKSFPLPKINKCIVSSLCAAGTGLSKLSEKAAECEIEFRTVRCVRGHQEERMFAYLFILRQQQQHLVVWDRWSVKHARGLLRLHSKQGFGLFLLLLFARQIAFIFSETEYSDTLAQISPDAVILFHGSICQNLRRHEMQQKPREFLTCSKLLGEASYFWR